MQNKNLKLKLGLCGLALTSFLAVNAHSVVHADTVLDSNSNNNAITWDSDSDDSQVVKEEPQQDNSSQSVQTQGAVQSSVQKQNAPATQSVQSNVQSKKQQVAVSSVSSTPVQAKRAETSIVRQSNVQTSTVNHLNANNQRNYANVKVAKVDSDAQMPVQTQVVAKFSQDSKTYLIKIDNPDNTSATETGKDDPHYTVASDLVGTWWATDHNVTGTTGGSVDRGIDYNQVELNGEAATGESWRTQFLTDTNAIYQGHRVGILIKPTITKETFREINHGDDYAYGWQGLQPEIFGFLPYAGSYKSDSDTTRDQQLNYSYVAVPVDMDTGDVIKGLSLVGTSVNGGKVPEWNVDKEYVNGVNKYTYTPDTDMNSGTVISNGTLKADQSEVLPAVKQAILDIKSGKVRQPTKYYKALPGESVTGFISTQEDYEWVNRFGKESDGSTPEFDHYHNTILPAEENIAYLAVQTRQVNPNDARAKRIAQRVIHVNFPNGVKPASYNGIVDNNNNIVQTVTFTRSGTENIADGSVQWGSWQGNGTFSPVTLPDIPGYTMTMS